MRRLEVRERRSLWEAKGLRREGIQWGDLGRIIAGGREGLRASTRELWGNDFFISSYLCAPAKGRMFRCQHARLYVLSSQSETLRTLFVSCSVYCTMGTLHFPLLLGRARRSPLIHSSKII